MNKHHVLDTKIEVEIKKKRNKYTIYGILYGSRNFSLWGVKIVRFLCSNSIYYRRKNPKIFSKKYIFRNKKCC
jgi:hypothetical protein